MVKEIKKPAKNQRYYSAEQWSTIRTLFESGNFVSITQLHKYCTKLFTPCPSLDSIKKRAGNDNWSKMALKEAIEEKKAENYKELFSELGLSERKMAEVMVNGVLCAEKMRDALIADFKEKGLAYLQDPLLMAQMHNNLNSLFSEMRTAHKYLETCLRLSGANPSEKKSVTIHGVDGNGLRLSRNYEEMSDEELDKEIDRLQSVKDVR